MTFEEFIISIQHDQPPDFSPYLESLWFERKGDWDKAHKIAQEIPDSGGSWIHAYIHRVEGDRWNSNYWYTKAGKKMPDISLKEEWESLVKYFLKKSG
jgi:hypothetical protein